MTDIPQNPESRPTEKHVLSLLKVDESENGPTDSSMTWRVFILVLGYGQLWIAEVGEDWVNVE